MKIKLALLFALLSFETFIHAAISFDCDGIKNLYDSLRSNNPENSAFVSAQDLAERFKLEKQFSNSAGGSNVYWVKDLSADRVVKIFPAESFSKRFEENSALRELYFSCKLAEEEFNFPNMSFSTADHNFFPRFFGYGYSDTDTPFEATAKKQDKKHFFMITELIKGKDMYEHSKALDPTSPLNDRTKTQAILYQIISALKQVYEKMGFFHRDLHPGNIIISEDKTVSFNRGNRPPFIAPMIKIINFGSGTSRAFYAQDTISPIAAEKLKLEPSRSKSAVLSDFAKNMGGSLFGTLFITKALRVSKQYQAGDDIHFFNMMIHVFRKIFAHPSREFDYCGDYIICQQKLSIFD